MVEIKPGFGEHTVLRYPGVGNESFGSKPSDLVIKFKLLPEATNYTRSGNDLYYVHTCSLIDALSLASFQVQTLDSRILSVTPSSTVTPQYELRIKGEGIAHSNKDIVIDTKNALQPKTQQPRGDLVIKFNITFPPKIMRCHRDDMVEALQMN